MSTRGWFCRAVTAALVWCVFAFALPAYNAQSKTEKTSTRAEVSDLLKRHDEALNRHDLDGVMALFAPGPRTVVLGTGPGERFQGLKEIREAYTEIFKDFDKGTMSHNCYWREGGGSVAMVWGAAECKFTDSKGDKRREYELNVSAVIEKRAGKWCFVLLHYSNLVGGANQQQ